ncbi:mono-functional DNA-alkylating methyl methanesulfonate N-term-domain-containing protein [Mycena rosella]|uniref:Mono-functional DNA-alkylating methyl methanesulfonate N-term-domain-containing protein n=1 Tax=Mycena rosella TaxID=1033263 RepID=A0AAD7DNQ1_MYCRO|nr:mono-functional DNA-alkylating methyl methanesulfonate N-term-domain-containing protein [Mycena rosella]
MKIVSTFHQPSSVLSSLKCHLTSAGIEHLVVAKLNGLDVYSVQPEGLKHQCKWEVWGNILSVKSVPTGDSSRSNLIVMLDHPEPELIFLTYTESKRTGGVLNTTKRLELHGGNMNQRPAEFFNDLIVHPDGKLAITSCFTGKLKGIVLHAGNYEDDFDASLMELTVLSIAFLPSSDEYSIAILHLDHARRVQLHARTVVPEEMDISRELSTVLHPTPISSKIIPYPEDAVPKLIPVPCPQAALGTDPDDETEYFIGGVLVVGGTRILLYEMASADGQTKQRNKRRKLEKGKESGNKAEVEKKQKERDTRKRKPKAFVDWPWSEITSCCAVDGEPFRYLIGDCFGRLCMLSLHDVPNNGLVLIPLGETSPPSTLTYLANQVVYVGSHAGDSQLVQISATPLSSSDETPTLPIPSDIETVPAGRLAPPSAKGKGREELAEPLRDCILDVKGSFLKVLDTFKNIAPILDAALVDTDNSGHQQIVTCSGGQNTGSINVMRKGADFQQLATVAGMAHTIGVFALRRTYDDMFDSHVLVLTLQDTYAFEMKGTDKLEQIESISVGFAPGRTLAARNVQRAKLIPPKERGNEKVGTDRIEYSGTPLVIQVTSRGAFLLEFDMTAFTQVHDYDVTSRGDSRGLTVVAASINSTQAVLALSTGTLLCLELNKDTNTLDLRRESTTILGHRSVSALSCMPLDPRCSASEFVVVAYWQTNEIEVLQQVPGGFVSVCKTAPLGAVVRSLLLHDFGAGDGDAQPYLFAGLGDGSLVYFPWNEQAHALGEPKLASLGNLPVCLTPCVVDGKKALLAAGSRAMVLSWERERIHNSPVVLKEVIAAAQIHTEHYQTSLILANESALFIGRVRDVDEMHIRSIPLGLDAPQRIVYEPSLKVFGVACTRREPTRIGAPEPPPRSSFRLLDDTTFNHISQYNCETDEEITCVTTLTLETDDESTAFFCLGTYTFRSEESVPAEGRLLVFTAYPPGAQSRSSNVELSLAASEDVEGCVYSVTTVNGLIAAGVNSAVMLFRLEMDPVSKACKLRNVSKINLNYFVTSLAGYENRLVLGDQISSVSLLEISEDSKLRTLGRDLTPLSPVCVQALGRNHIIAANDTLNLLSFTLDEESKKLDRDGFYQQSDFITKFVPGSITASDPGSKLEPVQMFFASSGRIGVIVDITDRQLGLDLTDLQRNMVENLDGAQNHTATLAADSGPHSRPEKKDQGQPAYGFLDGDFLERPARYPPAQLAKVVEGENEPKRLKLPLHEIQQLLKNLQSLH